MPKKTVSIHTDVIHVEDQQFELVTVSGKGLSKARPAHLTGMDLWMCLDFPRTTQKSSEDIQTATKIVLIRGKVSRSILHEIACAVYTQIGVPVALQSRNGYYRVVHSCDLVLPARKEIPPLLPGSKVVGKYDFSFDIEA